MGPDFLGALAYSDDIVLIVHHLLLYSQYVTGMPVINDYDIIFNADKSKFIVFFILVVI